MSESGNYKSQEPGSSRDLSSINQPLKVEVVVASQSAEGEVNILGELAIFVLRVAFS